MRTIKVYTGDTKEELFERGLHPISQVKKVKGLLSSSPSNIVVHTNSPFVAVALNKYGKEKNYAIEFYFENEKVLPEQVFDKFSKVLEKLIFMEEA